MNIMFIKTSYSYNIILTSMSVIEKSYTVHWFTQEMISTNKAEPRPKNAMSGEQIVTIHLCIQAQVKEDQLGFNNRRLSVLNTVLLLPLPCIETFLCAIRTREISRHLLTSCVTGHRYTGATDNDRILLSQCHRLPLLSMTWSAHKLSQGTHRSASKLLCSLTTQTTLYAWFKQFNPLYYIKILPLYTYTYFHGYQS